MYLADFHIHSNFSDGKLSIPELVDFYGIRGFGAIAITDHVCEHKTYLGKAAKYLNQCLTEEKFPIWLEILKNEAARAWDQYRMVVIPGMEFSKNSISNHRSAHVLAIGVEKYLSADDDIISLCQWTRNNGGLSIAAHPVDMGTIDKQTLYLWNRKEEFAPYFDAWEVASGPKIFREVLTSGLPIVASSDFHRPKHINAWKTKLSCERHPEAILNAIRKQELSYYFYEDRLPANLGALATRRSYA